MFQFSFNFRGVNLLNNGLSSAISEFEKRINYILVKVQSRSSLAKILNMSSEIAFPNLTFYTQRTKKILSIQRISMEL